MPAELRRAEPKIAEGAGIEGFWITDCARVAATGSATSSAAGTLSSKMRLTNEVLAPFSSRRRTR